MAEEKIAKKDEEEVQDPTAETGDDTETDGDEENQEPELWQTVESEEDPEKGVKDKNGMMPTTAHVRMKQKLKGRISERDEEIERLRLENESLKSKQSGETDKLARPRRDDFESDEDYDVALDDYEEKRAAQRYSNFEKKRVIANRQRQFKENLDKAVDAHYDRAGKLISEAGIDQEVFKQSDLTVREAINSIRPKEGDFIVDHVISILGEGSEKVIYFLGRNQNALDKAKSLLAEDPTGMRLSIYLGQQKERLTNPTKKKSQAPPPAPDANGDVNPNVQGKAKAFLKRYNDAHKQDNAQAMFNIKKEAKAAGVDVSSW